MNRGKRGVFPRQSVFRRFIRGFMEYGEGMRVFLKLLLVFVSLMAGVGECLADLPVYFTKDSLVLGKMPDGQEVRLAVYKEDGCFGGTGHFSLAVIAVGDVTLPSPNADGRKPCEYRDEIILPDLAAQYGGKPECEDALALLQRNMLWVDGKGGLICRAFLSDGVAFVFEDITDYSDARYSLSPDGSVLTRENRYTPPQSDYEALSTVTFRLKQGRYRPESAKGVLLYDDGSTREEDVSFLLNERNYVLLR